MALIDDTVAEQLKQELSKLVHPVRLVAFSSALTSPESEQVSRLIEELGALEPRLLVESCNFVLDKARAETLGALRIPAVAILGETRDYGIRFYGVPTGFEFGTLIDAILDVSSGDSGLLPATREALAVLEQPVHLQVFTTPTCGYCPKAVQLAYRFAIESDKVTSDGVEVTGFPDLVQRYSLSSVPKTVVGDKSEFVGAQPEALLLEHVQKAAALAGAIKV
jgi:glutaredoxin-like protein